MKRMTWVGLLVLTVLTLAYLAYQDQAVRRQFDGKRWALPARVYASPTELFAGAAMTADRFQWLLEELKFRSDARLSSKSTFWRKDKEFLVKTREFRYWDKLEAARSLRVRFSAGGLDSIEDLDAGRRIAILRMEPIPIGSFYPTLKEDRLLVKLHQVPNLLIKALFAIEDRHFYEHHGISPRAVARALWANLLAGSIVQGGSTLTQQLVKNFYLSSERSWWRKLNEAALAILLEARYPKDEILEAYLNEIYLGQDGARAIHGFGLASQYYFSRSLDELKLHHIALLVGLVQGPSYYDPLQFPERALTRRNVVLDAMVDTGSITQDRAIAAKALPLDVTKNPHQAISRYPAFLDLVKRQLQQEYRPEDLTSEGLRIFTTLDVEVQETLEASAIAVMKRLGEQTRSDQLETAAVLTRRSNGEIVAMIGSRDPKAAGFNRSLDASRQIGSLYKPVVFLTALEDPRRYNVMTPLADTSIRLKNPGGGPWVPHNYDRREHGTVPLRTALAQSYNLATVRLGMELGVPKTVKTLRRLGIDRDVPVFPSLLLGSATLTPMEVAQMYQTLASDGFVTPLRAIQSVTSQDGKPLRRFGLNVKPGVNPASVFLVNHILQEAVSNGTGRAVYTFLPRTFGVVGKTGTTNDLRDSWFAGFTGDYLGVVWVGRDDNRSAKLTGAQGALKIWATTMQGIGREPVMLTPPRNVELVRVHRKNGWRTDDDCPDSLLAPFVKGTAPKNFHPCKGDAEDESVGAVSGSDAETLF